MTSFLKISSISDVVTNSSTEVYVMDEEQGEFYEGQVSEGYQTYGCVYAVRIRWNEVLNYDFVNDINCLHFVCGVLQVKVPKMGFYHDDPIRFMKRWIKWCEDHREEINEKVIGKYLVLIEAHGKEEWTDRAAKYAIWSNCYD